MKNIIYLFIITIFSCSIKDNIKPKDQGIGDQEAITKFIINFDAGNGEITSASFNDPDASGPIVPTITGLSLKAGLIYNGTIDIYDESKTPIVFVNTEILEKANEHRFHYVFSPSVTNSMVNIDFDITDKDGNNQPLGLDFTANVSSISGTGKLRVTLRHFDNTSKTNNIEDGEADIDQEFQVMIVNPL